MKVVYALVHTVDGETGLLKYIEQFMTANPNHQWTGR